MVAGVSKRKVKVTGEPLEVSRVVGEGVKNSIIALPHGDKIIMVFLSDNNVPTAWAMSRQQAAAFSAQVTSAHQALKDDAKIAELEKAFGGEPVDDDADAADAADDGDDDDDDELEVGGGDEL